MQNMVKMKGKNNTNHIKKKEKARPPLKKGRGGGWGGRIRNRKKLNTSGFVGDG